MKATAKMSAIVGAEFPPFPTFSGLDVSVDGNVGEIRLSAPETLNSFDEALHVRFTAALAYLSRQAIVRAIVLSAAGRVFSVGGNFNYLLMIADDPTLRAGLSQGQGEIVAAEPHWRLLHHA